VDRLLPPSSTASALLIAACGGRSDPAPTATPPLTTEPAPIPSREPSPSPTAPPASAPYPVGSRDQQITVDGAPRQFRVHVPATLSGAPKAVVLVLALNGGGEGLNVASIRCRCCAPSPTARASSSSTPADCLRWTSWAMQAGSIAAPAHRFERAGANPVQRWRLEERARVLT
jgi:hypothetical protein